MKRKITNWMLLISALMLGVFILLVERNKENSRERQQRTRTVFEVYPEQITWLETERGGVEIACTKQGGSWRLTRPSDAPLNEAVVERMLAGMAGVERGQLLTAETITGRGLTPADYGFDEPRARITFRNNRGTSTWLIGRDAPLGDEIYVMAKGSGDIIRAPRTLLNLVPEDPAWIRERTFLSGSPGSVQGVDLHRTAGFLQLRRSETNGWLLQQPVTGRADSPPVTDWIETLFSGRIVGFITDEKSDLTAYGLETPAAKLTLFMQSGKTQTLQIGKTLGENDELFYAKRLDADSVFTVPSDWVAKLEIDVAGLRSRRLLHLTPDQINSITVSRNDKTAVLSKTNGIWQIMRPAHWPADPERIQQLLEKWTGASVAAFVDAPTEEQSAQIEDAPWTVTLGSPVGEVVLTLGSADQNDLRLARGTPNIPLCKADGQLVYDDLVNPLYYRAPGVLEINPADIERILLRTETSEQTVQKADSGSFKSGDSGRVLRTDALTDMMWELNDLRVERYVVYNPESLAPYGLETPDTQLTVILSSTDTLGQILLFGNETKAGRFAMIQGRPVVFVLNKKTAAILTQDLTRPAAVP
jgi:hypothetical protein